MTAPDIPALLEQVRDALHGSDSLVSVAELAAIRGVCRSRLHTLRALGRIGPQPVSTTGHPKWHRAEVAAWPTLPAAVRGAVLAMVDSQPQRKAA